MARLESVKHLRAICLLAGLTSVAATAQTSTQPPVHEAGRLNSEQAGPVKNQAASGTDEALSKTLQASTTALFNAFQHRNVLGFLAGITPEFTYVGPEGVLSIDALAGIVEGCTLTSYSVSSPRLHTLTADAAVLVYRHHQDATCGGRPLPSEMIGTDLYVRKDGRWLISLHTETVPQ